ncbi:MAG: hypothetical protein IJX76_08135 [Clostridia bacterium]|nr:hypothetical protein [Clostridia bacterium]
MREIKELSELIDDEIEAACDYAEAAERTGNDDLRRLYIELANAELGHIDKLHGKAKEMIAQTRSKGIVSPAGMMEMWTHEHERMIRKVSKIKMRLETAAAM